MEGYKVNITINHFPIYKQRANVIWNLKHIIIYISTPKVKYFGINLTKYVQDLYEENSKTDEKYQRRT